MAPQRFLFDPPERFVAGTVGEPGQRTFFLQARDAARLASVVLEKEQVALLAERLDALLDEVARRVPGAAVPVAPPEAVEDLAPLEQPIDPDFRVGTMTLAWDGSDNRVVIEAFAAADGDEDDTEAAAAEPSDRDRMVVRITHDAARAFVRRAHAVVAAGRPPCPLCGLPLDPHGHVCPRLNGHRPRT
ncbi:MAG: DUF3090 family protein [Jiangellaceae bacterium]|nr:DUF3090 family protein [Jiangellaceae bacterium]